MLEGAESHPLLDLKQLIAFAFYIYDSKLKPEGAALAVGLHL